MGYININSIRNKFSLLSDQVSNYIDILTIAETKLDSSFSDNQFLLPNFRKPFRLDIKSNSGGLLILVKNDIPARKLNNFPSPIDIQVIPFEITIKLRKWLLLPVYNPNKSLARGFLTSLSNIIDFYLSSYECFVIYGDMNLAPEDKDLKDFMDNYSLSNLIKNNTCFKSSKGSCIDLILTNQASYFQHSSSFETGLSDCHHLIYTMFKSKYYKLPPTSSNFRNFSKFNFDRFLNEFESSFSKNVIKSDFSTYLSTMKSTLDKQAPLKTKILRGNHQSFVDNQIRKELSKRARLKNIANKTGKIADYCLFKKQRNYIVNLIRKKITLKT